jgi:hypothetical protein
MQAAPVSDISVIKTIIEAGGSTALTLALMYAVKTLWQLVMSKDSQLMEERDKREELIKESILASRSMFESTEKIVQALERIERKVVDHDKDS